MKQLIAKIRPASGFSKVIHTLLLIIIPVAIFAFIRLNFVQLAFSLVLLSKWRMISVKPRFWLANMRANSVDIIVGLSIVLFMARNGSVVVQAVWALLYIFWLVILKPATGIRMVSIQAFIGMLIGLMALFFSWTDGPLYGITLLSGAICYFSARHFFDAYDEPYAKLLSYSWGYFGAALSWLLAHWLIYYGILSMPTLIICSIGFGLGLLYYIDHVAKVTKLVKQQVIFIMIALIMLVITFSKWGDKVI